MGELVCTICTSSLASNVGRLHCNHYFCLGCINQWASSSTTCPICRKEFKEVLKVKLNDSYLTESPITPSKYSIVLRIPFKKRRFKAPQEDELPDPEQYQEQDEECMCCTVCGSDHEPNLLIACDTSGCNRASHTFCVGLDRMPQELWFCDQCQQQNYPLTSSRSRRVFDNEYFVDESEHSSAESEYSCTDDEEEQTEDLPLQRRRSASQAQRRGTRSQGQRHRITSRAQRQNVAQRAQRRRQTTRTTAPQPIPNPPPSQTDRALQQLNPHQRRLLTGLVSGKLWAQEEMVGGASSREARQMYQAVCQKCSHATYITEMLLYPDCGHVLDEDCVIEAGHGSRCPTCAVSAQRGRATQQSQNSGALDPHLVKEVLMQLNRTVDRFWTAQNSGDSNTSTQTQKLKEKDGIQIQKEDLVGPTGRKPGGIQLIGGSKEDVERKVKTTQEQEYVRPSQGLKMLEGKMKGQSSADGQRGGGMLLYEPPMDLLQSPKRENYDMRKGRANEESSRGGEVLQQPGINVGLASVGVAGGSRGRAMDLVKLRRLAKGKATVQNKCGCVDSAQACQDTRFAPAATGMQQTQPAVKARDGQAKLKQQVGSSNVGGGGCGTSIQADRSAQQPAQPENISGKGLYAQPPKGKADISQLIAARRAQIEAQAAAAPPKQSAGKRAQPPPGTPRESQPKKQKTWGPYDMPFEPFPFKQNPSGMQAPLGKNATLLENEENGFFRSINKLSVTRASQQPPAIKATRQSHILGQRHNPRGPIPNRQHVASSQHPRPQQIKTIHANRPQVPNGTQQNITQTKRLRPNAPLPPLPQKTQRRSIQSSQQAAGRRPPFPPRRAVYDPQKPSKYDDPEYDRYYFCDWRVALQRQQESQEQRKHRRQEETRTHAKYLAGGFGGPDPYLAAKPALIKVSYLLGRSSMERVLNKYDVQQGLLPKGAPLEEQNKSRRQMGPILGQQQGTPINTLYCTEMQQQQLQQLPQSWQQQGQSWQQQQQQQQQQQSQQQLQFQSEQQLQRRAQQQQQQQHLQMQQWQWLQWQQQQQQQQQPSQLQLAPQQKQQRQCGQVLDGSKDASGWGQQYYDMLQTEGPNVLSRLNGAKLPQREELTGLHKADIGGVQQGQTHHHQEHASIPARVDGSVQSNAGRQQALHRGVNGAVGQHVQVGSLSQPSDDRANHQTTQEPSIVGGLPSKGSLKQQQKHASKRSKEELGELKESITKVLRQPLSKLRREGEISVEEFKSQLRDVSRQCYDIAKHMGKEEWEEKSQETMQRLAGDMFKLVGLQ